MDSKVSDAIRFATPVRECPYCRGRIEDGEVKSVCNTCLAPSHAECWEEAGRCPCCQSQDRLVQEGVSRPKPERRSGGGGGFSLSAPVEVRDPGETRIDPGTFGRIRAGELYSRLLTEEGQRELRAIQLEREREEDPVLSLKMKLIYCGLLTLAFILSPSLGALSLLGIIAIIGHALYTMRMGENALYDRWARRELIPVPAVVTHRGEVRDSGCTIVFAFDKDGPEEVEGGIPVEDGELPLIAFEVSSEAARPLAPGVAVLMVIEQGRAIWLKQVS